ncbi:hypothetical protein BSKO_12479 [Bryopsis sp. KO-2023]|nr:hypothetical protein BSKO_12479 [Bryopsis sp. KO-2023]
MAETTTAAGGDESVWRVAETQSVTLEPFGCQNFEFVLPSESVGKLSFSESEIPTECYPEATLWMTSELYQNGYCFDWDYRSDKCLSPDTAGLLFKEELCKNWDFLSQTYFRPNFNTTTDYNCLEEQKYFFAIRSSCYWPVKFNMTMETRNLTVNEDVVCTVLENVLGLKVFEVVGIIAAIAFIVIVVAFVLCCCCCCPCCPLFKKRSRYHLLRSMQRAGYAPISEDDLESSVLGTPVSLQGTPVSQGTPVFDGVPVAYLDDKTLKLLTEDNANDAGFS